MQKTAASTKGTFGKSLKFAGAAAAVIVMTVFTVGIASAGTPAASAAVQTQSVNVVNTPTVNVGNTPSVTVANTPEVSISGTPTVNANATITAPGPLTNVGRLASQQVGLEFTTACPSHVFQINNDGTRSCFDIANHPGQVLIITDLDWLGSGTPGNTCIASVTNSVGSAFFLSVSVEAADQWAAKTEHMTTGLKMSENPQFAMMGACTLSVFQAQGYLVPNQ
jgi:hypothetical protein